MANETPGSDAPKSKLTIALWIAQIALIVFWGAMAVGAGRRTIGVLEPVALWGIGILIIVILLALAGREINGQWFGVLIDSRNKLSLSRLQIALWTIMVLSAYLTMVIPRVTAMVGDKPKLTQEQALNISFPEELILAMGISAASFAGSNLIQSNKKNKQIRIEAKSTPELALKRLNEAKKEFEKAEDALLTAAQEEVDKKKELDGAAESERAKLTTEHNAKLQNKENVAKDRDAKKKALEAAQEDHDAIQEAQGLLHKNADPSEARWVDLFRGEEIANYKLVEMAKVQMLLFTVAVIAAYAATIYSSILRDGEALRTLPSLSFPPFAPSLNALLGISHGTYLSVKTVDHS